MLIVQSKCSTLPSFIRNIFFAEENTSNLICFIKLFKMCSLPLTIIFKKIIKSDCGIKSICLSFRPFYVSTTTTIPRDVVVVLETSSSMRGDKQYEAKHAVITVMETLGVEDRVSFLCLALI